MTSDLIKAKLKASGIHLAISVFIFVGILYLILFEWYPGVFFEAEGGWSGIKLMVAVDLILGPSLTFIIFNHTKAKKEIVFDLSLIAIVQISALTWGGLQVYSERPVALVMWEGEFYTVTEDYYKKQDINLEDVAVYSDEKPLIIFAETDHTVPQLEEIERLSEQKIPPYAQVHLYNNVHSNISNVMANRIDYSLLRQEVKLESIDETDLANVNAFLGKAKYKNLVVYLTNSGGLLGIKAK